MAQNPYPTTHLRQRAHTKQQSNTSGEQTGGRTRTWVLFPGRMLYNWTGHRSMNADDGRTFLPTTGQSVPCSTDDPNNPWRSQHPPRRRRRRPRRLDTAASRRPRFRFVPATERLSLRLLTTTATSLTADVPWLPSSPASRRSTLRSPQQRTGTAVPSLQWWQLSPDEALLRLTRSNRPGANSLSTHCRATLNSNCTSARLFTTLPLTAKHTCVH